MLFVLFFLAFCVSAEKCYFEYEDNIFDADYLFADLNKCFPYGGYSAIAKKISENQITIDLYTDSSCSGNYQSYNYNALFEEPSEKYKVVVYSDKQCSTSLNVGALYSSNSNNLPLEKLGKCYVDGNGLYTTLNCGKGYTNKNGDCSKISCSVSNCNSCESEDYCSVCDYGYSVSNGKCIKDQETNGESILFIILSLVFMTLF